MNALKRLAQAGGTNSVGTHTFIDADTIRDADGTSYRLQGYDAPEVAGFKGGQWKAGTAGAADATRTITSLAEQQGFTNMVKTGTFDPNGREIVELHDESGRNFTTELLKSGALGPGKYTTQEDLNAIDVARAFGHQSDDGSFAEAAKEIQGAIEGETQRPIEFLQGAVTEGTYGTAALDFRRTDRDLQGNSLNPLSDSWEMGWLGAKEGVYGMLNLLGEETSSEWLADIGEAGVARAQANSEEYAKVLTDWKDVNGINSGISYIANNAAMSLPYMITTAGAAVAGGLVGGVAGGALAIGAPATVYAGQAWNEQEGEKSAEWALSAGLAQAALDRIGIGIISGKIPNDVQKAAINKIMKSTGLGRGEAERMLANATKEELAGFLQDTAKTATKQITAKRVGQEFLKNAAAGSLGEAGTEVMQEAIAYTGAKKGELENFDWEELTERLTAAAIAGGTLGGAFTVPRSINTIARERARAGDNALADETTATQSALWAQEELNANGYIATNQENLSNLREQIATEGVGFNLEERAVGFEEKQRGRTLEEKARDTFNAIPSLWRGATRNIFTDSIMQRSRSARIAADLFGGNPDRVFSGASFEDAKHHRVAQYKNMVDIPNRIFSVMNDGRKFSSSDKARISNEIYTQLRGAVDKDGKFDSAKVTGKHRDTIIHLGKQLNTLSDKMYADQKKHNPELGYIDNYLFKYKSLNKKAIHNNRKGFEKLLRTTYKMSPAEAKEITERLTDDPNIGDIDEAFSVVKGGIVPGSHKKRSLGLSEKKEFEEFLENDIFANISHAAKSAARYTAHRDYIGKNGEVVAKLVDNIQKELGDTPEAQLAADKIAKQMKDYLDAESGNYKRPKSEFGKKAQKIQKNAMMLMTLSGLPLATISSFVESALVTRSLTNDQIFGKNESSLTNQGKSLAKSMMDGVLSQPLEVIDVARDKQTHNELSENQQRLKDLGFYEWDVGAATVTGVTEVNAWQQKLYEGFFRANGLTQWTDFTRGVRASFAGDYLSDNARKIYEQRKGGQPYTRDIQETELKLRNIGINIDRFLPLQEKVTAGQQLNPEEQIEYDTAIREATFSFVNDAIVLPQSANRPLIYQDPRFALFTQFQGFLSTFTTKVLPKLYRDAFGGSTPSMQYQAWATMATMIMLGFASQHLKDLLKYGTDEEEYERKTGLNPYLDTAEYARRGLLSTGLLGTGERVINAMFPIYETRSDNAGDWLFNQAVGESPALGYVERVAGAAGALAGGDVGRAAEQVAKATPVFGPFSLANKKIGELAGEWNFDG